MGFLFPDKKSLVIPATQMLESFGIDKGGILPPGAIVQGEANECTLVGLLVFFLALSVLKNIISYRN